MGQSEIASKQGSQGNKESIGRELAYNVITNNGLGAGLYFEFLPYTQEIGGYEQLGFYACQADPNQVAAHIRTLMGEWDENFSN